MTISSHQHATETTDALYGPSVGDFWQLLKPRVMSLVIFTGFAGMFLAPAGMHPLLFCIAGFVLLFIALVFLRTQTEIRARRMRALLARERLG